MADEQAAPLIEGDDVDGEHNKEVYARFGVAYYLANCLEQTMVTALLALDHFTQRLADRRREPALGFDRDDFINSTDAFQAKHQRMTLGNLRKRLAELAPLPEGLAKDLGQALERRNFLAHHFFRERAFSFVSHAGRAAMIAELEADMALFGRVDDALHAFLEPHRARLGLGEEVLAPRIRRFLEENGLDPDLLEDRT